uniref:C-type lectin domain-containing protein n=1 Tax=Astyanax mexicanus TaxID=7994 RepID=W5KR61_ASTMX
MLLRISISTMCFSLIPTLYLLVQLCSYSYKKNSLWSPSSARLRYYYLVTEPKTWVQAQSYCRQKYTDLATVDSMAEMEELKGFIPPGFSDSIWIGLKRGPMRLWGWSSGEVLQYTNWNPGEPNGVVTDRWCGAIYKLGGWIDTSCTNMFNSKYKQHAKE